MWRFYVNPSQRLRGPYEWFRRQPTWRVRVALVAGVIVFVLPLLALTLLILALLVVGGLAFALVAIALSVITWPIRVLARRGSVSRDDGRRNVRVILPGDRQV